MRRGGTVRKRPRDRAPSFDEIRDLVADVDGWMTGDQARRLHDRATELLRVSSVWRSVVRPAIVRPTATA